MTESGEATSTRTTHSSPVETLLRISRWSESAIVEALPDGEDVPGLDAWRVIGQLGRADGQTMSDIASTTGLSRPTMSRVIDRLVSAGLVHRRVDAEDRRRAVLHLTIRGTTRAQAWCHLEQQLVHRFAVMMAPIDVGAVLNRFESVISERGTHNQDRHWNETETSP